jgi:hypothetical protein
MAEVECRPQRLMPAQHEARASRQDVEALVEVRAQAVDAQQGNASGRKLERKRDAVEAPADLHDRLGVGAACRKPRIRGARAAREQLHRPVILPVGALRVRRDCKRPHAKDVLERRLERLLARDENAYAAGGP